VENQRIRRARPVGWRNRGAELLFDDDGIVGPGDANAVRDAEDMTIDRQAWHAQRVPEDHVRGLATDAGQLDQILHRARDLASVMFDNRGRHADEGA